MSRVYFFLLIFSLCLASSGLSQNKWAEESISIAGPNYIALEECGDTLIEGILYQKLWQSEYDYPSFNLQGGYEFAYTRTNKDSVFIRQKTSLTSISDEKLLYTFNLQLGDTISTFMTPEKKFKVIQIDTVFTLNQQRRKISLQHIETMDLDIWLEGIGSLYNGYLLPGLTSNFADIGGTILCHYDADSDLYWTPNNQPSACFLEKMELVCSHIAASKQDLSEIQFQVYPNPFSETIILDDLPPQTIVNIYDVRGHLTQKLSLNGSQHQVNLKDYPAGLYYLSVLGEKNRSGEKKIIKF